MHLMAWFGELSGARRSGMTSPEPIGWGDIAAWCALTGAPLQPNDARLLRALDVIWLAAWHEGQPDRPAGRGA